MCSCWGVLCNVLLGGRVKMPSCTPDRCPNLHDQVYLDSMHSMGRSVYMSSTRRTHCYSSSSVKSRTTQAAADVCVRRGGEGCMQEACSTQTPVLSMPYQRPWGACRNNNGCCCCPSAHYCCSSSSFTQQLPMPEPAGTAAPVVTAPAATAAAAGQTAARQRQQHNLGQTWGVSKVCVPAAA